MTTKEHHGAKYYWKCKGCTEIEYGIPDERCEKCKKSTPQEIKKRRLEVASTRSRKAREHLKAIKEIKEGRKYCPFCGKPEHEEKGSTVVHNSHSGGERQVSSSQSPRHSSRYKSLPNRSKEQQERIERIREVASREDR